MGYRQSFDEDYEFEVRKDYQGGYEVSLPHQCDDWKILGWEQMENEDIPTEPFVGEYPARPTRKEFAIQRMELFCQRANEALEKLKEL